MTATTPVEIEVPAAVDELNLLSRVDYEDAYAVDTEAIRTPEQWMRAFVQDAPRWFQLPWVGLGKLLLGAKFGPLYNSRDHVLGWTVLHDGPDAFAIGLDSTGGLSARLVSLAPAGRAIVATQICLSTRYARAISPLIRRGHRYFAPYLLARAAAGACLE
jgi:hypothetical protein